MARDRTRERSIRATGRRCARSATTTCCPSRASCRASCEARSSATGRTRSSIRPMRTGSSATACCTPSRWRTARPAIATAGCARRSSWPSMTPAAPSGPARASAARSCPMRRLRPSSTAASPIPTSSGTRGKLLALEEAHLPTEIDPKTLATRGYVDYARGIAGPVTAHPKIDPVTGELIFFGYNATGPFSTGMTYRRDRGFRRRQPLRAVRGALLQHGARLHRHGKATCCSRSCR